MVLLYQNETSIVFNGYKQLQLYVQEVTLTTPTNNFSLWQSPNHSRRTGPSWCWTPAQNTICTISHKNDRKHS